MTLDTREDHHVDPGATMRASDLLRSLRWFAASYCHDLAADCMIEPTEAARTMAEDSREVAHHLYGHLGRAPTSGELSEVLAHAAAWAWDAEDDDPC